MGSSVENAIAHLIGQNRIDDAPAANSDATSGLSSAYLLQVCLDAIYIASQQCTQQLYRCVYNAICCLQVLPELAPSQESALQEIYDRYLALRLDTQALAASQAGERMHACM